MGKGIFGGLFDFNRDGKMSTFERATEFAFLNGMLQKDTADCTDWDIDDDEDDSWRDYCEDGSEYDINPEDYETEEEYEEALEEAKVAQQESTMWHQMCNCQENYAGNAVKTETHLRKKSSMRYLIKEQITEEALADKTIYHYCGVIFEGAFLQLYHYRTNDTSLKIGDKVVVPVGPKNEECLAQIVSIEQHTRISVPYPVEKTKFIIRKHVV